ncbi:hypothetical protein F8O01_00960 [Pseudoclavibacter chungangensis]|uniref:SdpI family protein n=1 Tax=Pseudoclavibacter chungangensis TaxID=587635 RepID=A0A7J5C1N5_9MICO|nr:SdpI family protein [Pseudoclavibacter chungangensis]KAB1662547.1 hypothetical protein F8O01_00960 [Pseudoclavibacter chungangensis]NYJ68589.1 hypothetical protein [Pseudoclavibacter chungangensis]
MDGFQSPPIGSAILVAILLIVGNAIVILTVRLCASGRILPGGLAGIRTAATRSSDAAWIAGHRAARPVADIGQGLGAVAGAVTLVVSGTVVPYLVTLGITIVLTLGSVVTGAIVADRAARRELAR